jgi:large subunit ribosomal protein L18
MIQHDTIKQRRGKRVARIRAVLKGTDARPRLAIHRSHTRLYGQLIDDEKNITLKSFYSKGTNTVSALELGKSIVNFCKEKSIKKLVYDRGGFKYHGVIKQVADTVREGGVTI